MAISLVKGQKIDLTKTNRGLKRIMVGLGWDVNDYGFGDDYDLDASAFLLNDYGEVNSEDDLVYFGNLKHYSGAVQHMGDNLTGEGDGDDEQILVDLNRIPSSISKIAFVCCIYDAHNRDQNFGEVDNAFIRIVDADTGRELVRYDLCEDFSIETSVIVGELYRHNGEWKFNAVGSGFDGELGDLCEYYGLDV